MIVIVDNSGANLGSIFYALERLNHQAVVSADPNIIKNAHRIILPGVGAAHTAMNKLREHDLDALLPTLTQPVLGICLGMQLLFTHSEEGDTPCLDIISGEVLLLPQQPNITIPHMGWNRLHSVTNQHPLLAGIHDDDYVYFVHSYYADVGPTTLAASTHAVPFSAIVQKDNFFGMQFHPERSGPVGTQLLNNFLTLKD